VSHKTCASSHRKPATSFQSAREAARARACSFRALSVNSQPPALTARLPASPCVVPRTAGERASASTTVRVCLWKQRKRSGIDFEVLGWSIGNASRKSKQTTNDKERSELRHRARERSAVLPTQLVFPGETGLGRQRKSPGNRRKEELGGRAWTCSLVLEPAA
jgi:hypothetical protein